MVTVLAGVGELWAGDAFGTGFGVGVATVRVRVEGEDIPGSVVVEEFEFCPQTHPADATMIEVVTRSLFNIIKLLNG
ncbi:MAG TPA: hypothetical protein VJT71_00905, partial [Pyrinomonadaceae bacterium]|nr:hypothetical protein [Pyrinomonadaceae bacterium]